MNRESKGSRKKGRGRARGQATTTDRGTVEVPSRPCASCCWWRSEDKYKWKIGDREVDGRFGLAHGRRYSRYTYLVEVPD